MISSSIHNQLDSVLSLLTDSKKISKLIEELKVIDKSAKESLKSLAGSKSAKSMIDDAAKAVEASKKEVEEARLELQKIKKEEAKVKNSGKEYCKAKEEALKLRENAIDVNLKKSSEALVEAEAQREVAEKYKDTAKQEEIKMLKLRKQYEDKLQDIKSRLSGL